MDTNRRSSHRSVLKRHNATFDGKYGDGGSDVSKYHCSYHLRPKGTGGYSAVAPEPESTRAKVVVVLMLVSCAAFLVVSIIF